MWNSSSEGCYYFSFFLFPSLPQAGFCSIAYINFQTYWRANSTQASHNTAACRTCVSRVAREVARGVCAGRQKMKRNLMLNDV